MNNLERLFQHQAIHPHDGEGSIVRFEKKAMSSCHLRKLG